MYHDRANNVYSLNQSKRKDWIGREAKEEVVFVLAASKPGDFSVFPVLKLDELCTENRFWCAKHAVVQSSVVEGWMQICYGISVSAFQHRWSIKEQHIVKKLGK